MQAGEYAQCPWIFSVLRLLEHGISLNRIFGSMIQQKKSSYLIPRLAIFVLLLSPLSSCNSQTSAPPSQKSSSSNIYPEQQSPPPDQYAVTPNIYAEQSGVLEAQRDHLRHVEVTVTAPVYKLLRDDNQGIPHQRFLIKLANGSTVLIAHDTNMAPKVPLSPGCLIRIHGEYIWTDRGGVIHWTHHTDTPRHTGGWIDCNGQRYQ